MHVVVIDRLGGDAAAKLPALAHALGKTAYECRPIVNVPEGGPVVVACHARVPEAEAMAARLRAADFHAQVLPDTIASPIRAFAARTFALGKAALHVEARDGRSLEIRYDEIEVLVRGSELTRESHTETTTKKKLAVGRAVLSGGLMLTRKEKTKRTTTTTDSQGLIVMFSRSAPPVVLGEKSLLYQSLGPAMQPSRTANFMIVVGELRRRCVHATWDERLMRRAIQQQVLGPTLSADEYFDLAIALVAASVRSQ